jgi:HSP20 family protein
MYDLITREFDNIFNLPSVSNGAKYLSALKEEEGNFLLEVDMPGIPPDNIEVSLDRGILTVVGKTDTRHVKKSWTVNKGINFDEIDARAEHGVLTITLPKVEKEKPRLIPVKVS